MLVISLVDWSKLVLFYCTISTFVWSPWIVIVILVGALPNLSWWRVFQMLLDNFELFQITYFCKKIYYQPWTSFIVCFLYHRWQNDLVHAREELNILFVVWLCFKAHPRIFHSYGDVTIVNERLQNFGLCSVPTKYERYQSQAIKSQNWISETLSPSGSPTSKVKSVLLYGSECWSVIVSFIQKQLLT